MGVFRSPVLTSLTTPSVAVQEPVEDGEVPHSEAEATRDYLETLFDTTQRAIRVASTLPTGLTYSIEASDHANSELASATALKVVNDLLNILNYACPKTLESGPVPVASAKELAKNYDKFVDSVEALLVKVDQGLDLCDKSSPHTLMAEVLQSGASNTANRGDQVASQSVDGGGPPSRTRRALLPHLEGSASAPNFSSSEVTLRPRTVRPRSSEDLLGYFVPCLKQKFHAREPLAEDIVEAQKKWRAAEVAADMAEDAERTDALSKKPPIRYRSSVSAHFLPHPYRSEIQHLTWDSPQSAVYTPSSVKLYNRLEDTPLVWVRTPEELTGMINELRTCSEIAIDLEHHSQHSFRGITCLIQISSRVKDYIVDPVDLKEDLTALNIVTTDPNIVKVLHGADRDVIWLQRDFSVYIINLFDTGQAARVIDLPGGASLANLLSVYCKVTANKAYQLADWRVRPLPNEMVEYARCDTHYLLYIYDVIRNALLLHTTDPSSSATSDDKGILVTERGRHRMRVVLERSRDIALKTYTGALEDPEIEAEVILSRTPVPLAPPSFAVFVDLVDWRTRLAYALDESPHVIAPGTLLARIASKSPRTWSGLQAIASPLPRYIQLYATDILDIIGRKMSSVEPGPLKTHLEEDCPMQSCDKRGSIVTLLPNPSATSEADATVLETSHVSLSPSSQVPPHEADLLPQGTLTRSQATVPSVTESTPRKACIPLNVVVTVNSKLRKHVERLVEYSAAKGSEVGRHRSQRTTNTVGAVNTMADAFQVVFGASEQDGTLLPLDVKTSTKAGASDASVTQRVMLECPLLLAKAVSELVSADLQAVPFFQPHSTPAQKSLKNEFSHDSSSMRQKDATSNFPAQDVVEVKGIAPKETLKSKTSKIEILGTISGATRASDRKKRRKLERPPVEASVNVTVSAAESLQNGIISETPTTSITTMTSKRRRMAKTEHSLHHPTSEPLGDLSTVGPPTERSWLSKPAEKLDVSLHTGSNPKKVKKREKMTHLNGDNSHKLSSTSSLSPGKDASKMAPQVTKPTKTEALSPTSKAVNFLPASTLTKSSNAAELLKLPTVSVPKLFGNTAEKSSKHPQSKGMRKKKKKFGL